VHFDFLIDTYETERLKVLSTWSTFHDEDLKDRADPSDPRSRSAMEHMIHQCASEHGWFVKMLGIDIDMPTLPSTETRMAFIEHYATVSEKRESALREKTDTDWWMEEVSFFEVGRSRAWVLTRRITHTAHHRGQQTTLLRVLGKKLFSTYGPTADTGGLPVNKPEVVYPYRDVGHLIESEKKGSGKNTLPEPTELPYTEKP
jgi:uncharacterized damage-inducible protein DinB